MNGWVCQTKGFSWETAHVLFYILHFDVLDTPPAIILYVLHVAKGLGLGLGVLV